MIDLVGPLEIAAMLDVKPQTVRMWRFRRLLPEPGWVISGVPIWERSEILAWARDTGRHPGNAGEG